VDDNADMRQSWSAFSAGVLRWWRQKTERSRWSRLQRVPDLVLTDVMMPELDGFRSAQSLRKIPPPATCCDHVQHAPAKRRAIEGVDAGADDYLTKPSPGTYT